VESLAGAFLPVTVAVLILLELLASFTAAALGSAVFVIRIVQPTHTCLPLNNKLIQIELPAAAMQILCHKSKYAITILYYIYFYIYKKPYQIELFKKKQYITDFC